MKQSPRLLILVIAITSLLAACAPAALTPAATTVPSATAAVPVTAATATETTAPVEEPTTAPTDSPTEVSAASSTGTRIFAIVPEQSEASYEVQETFADRPLPVTAIGKTTIVEGQFEVNLDGKPTGQVTQVTVDLRGLTSDNSRRDRRIRTQWLESERYPLATFVSREIQGGPETYAEGQEVRFQLLGDLTIREITQPVTFDVVARLDGDTITGTATAEVLMRDFGFDPPDIINVLSVQDGVKVTLNFTAKEVK